jgi:hypothetical protein
MSTLRANTLKPITSGNSLVLQGDSGGSGVSGPSIDSNGDVDFTQNTNAKVKLPSGGGIYESDGSTAILTESGGAVTIENCTFSGTIGSSARANSIQPATSQDLELKNESGTTAISIDDTASLSMIKTDPNSLTAAGFSVDVISGGLNGITIVKNYAGAGAFGTAVWINRQNGDGTLIEFAENNASEGSISVSGSTVSYNGGHLSRWAQLPDSSKDESILKGTVMTNLDQMSLWHHEAQAATFYEEGDEIPDGMSVGDQKTPAKEAYDEENEQLNTMEVSSVEGDPNVAGVFVNWDDDQNFNDMNVAMTGDMVIRISQGISVARGDLLMSAGDGTAKPQGDDIVRSKTIAKVTSTHVSHTYSDGSYLVPCVVMAS